MYVYWATRVTYLVLEIPCRFACTTLSFLQHRAIDVPARSLLVTRSVLTPGGMSFREVAYTKAPCLFWSLCDAEIYVDSCYSIFEYEKVERWEKEENCPRKTQRSSKGDTRVQTMPRGPLDSTKGRCLILWRFTRGQCTSSTLVSL